MEVEDEFTLDWFKRRSVQIDRELEDLFSRTSDSDDEDYEIPKIDVEPFILAFGSLSLSEQIGVEVEEDEEEEQERIKCKESYEEHLSTLTEPPQLFEDDEARPELDYCDQGREDDKEFYKYVFHQRGSEEFNNHLYQEYVTRNSKCGDESESMKSFEGNEIASSDALRDDATWSKYNEQRILRTKAMEKLLERVDDSEKHQSSPVDNDDSLDSCIRQMQTDNYIIEGLTSDESESSDSEVELPELTHIYSSAIEFEDTEDDEAEYLKDIQKHAEKRLAVEAANRLPCPPEVLDFEDKEEARREDEEIEKRRAERNNARARREKSKKKHRKEVKVDNQKKPSKDKVPEPKTSKSVDDGGAKSISPGPVQKNEDLVVEPSKESAKVIPENDSSSDDDDLAALEAMAAGKLKSKR